MERFRASYLLLLIPLVLVLCGYVVYPMAMVVLDSLHVQGAFSLGHYEMLLDPANRSSWEAIWNSIAVSLVTVVLSAVVGTFLAVVFTQMGFPLRRWLSRLAILPIALPPLVGVIAFLFVYGESGFVPKAIQSVLDLKNVPLFLEGRTAVVVVHVYSFYVYSYLFVSTALRQLDGSLFEAAASLGSDSWRTFRKVVYPAIRPALLGSSVLTFMTSMASFSAPFLFGGQHRFMTTLIYSTKLNGEMDYAAAQSVLLTMVSVAFFVVFRMVGRSTEGPSRSKGTPRSSPLRIGRRARLVMIGLCVLLLVAEMLPILTIIVISFVREGSWTWQILPTVYTFENYVKLLSDVHIFEPIRNSVLMSLLTVVAAILVGVTAAYLISKGGLRRMRFVADLIVTMPFALPGTVVAISLILAFNSPSLFSGYSILVGSFAILPLAYFIRLYPLVVRSTVASLDQLDDSLMEVAETFGAGLLRRFRRVALPLILRGIVSGALLVVIAALGEFVSSILLYTYESRPISIEILSQLRAYNFGAAAAYCVVLLLMILACTFLSNLLSRRPGSSVDF